MLMPKQLRRRLKLKLRPPRKRPMPKLKQHKKRPRLKLRLPKKKPMPRPN
jgi:hypothetical protein